jgi:hypothetical protein
LWGCTVPEGSKCTPVTDRFQGHTIVQAVASVTDLV